MPATHKLTRPRGIPKEAVLTYPLVPAGCDDPYGWAAVRLEARGFTPIAECWEVVEGTGVGWIMLSVWAVPPERTGSDG